MKLQLVYLRDKWMSCIPHAHYDLCTVEKEPKNVACILVSHKDNIKILKDMVKAHNKREK